MISAEQILFDGQVSLVTLPGESGQVGLVDGEFVINPDNAQRETMDIAGGIVDVDRNVVSVCIY